MACFPLLSFEAIELPEGPPRTPYESRCNYEAVAQTLSQGGCSMDEYDSGEACCPRALVPYFCGVTESKFSRARLDGSMMRGMTLSLAHFEHASLRNVELENTVILSSNFDGSDLSRSDLTQSVIRGSSFVGVNASRLLLGGSEIYDSSFAQSNLWQIDLTESAIRRTNLDETIMVSDSNSEAGFVGLHNFAMGAHEDDQMVIRGARWMSAHFSGIVFKNVVFEAGDLSGIKFGGARFERVEFRSQYVDEDTVPTETDEPQSIDFRPELDLTGSEFFQSKLDGVSFDRVVLDGTRFEQVEFDEFKEPGQVTPSRFERINVDGAKPLIFLQTDVRRTLFDSVNMPSTVFAGDTIEQTVFGKHGGVMFQGAQFGGSVIDFDGESIGIPLTVSESVFRRVDFGGADFSRAEFRSANTCKMNLFNQESHFTGAVFSTSDSAAVLSGVGRFKTGLEMSFRGVCACEDAAENIDFFGGAPLLITGPDHTECQPYVLDCASWPVCELDLYR